MTLTLTYLKRSPIYDPFFEDNIMDYLKTYTKFVFNGNMGYRIRYAYFNREEVELQRVLIATSFDEFERELRIIPDKYLNYFKEENLWYNPNYLCNKQ